MDIGTTLRHLREEKGYTQEQVAKKIGVTKATVNRYETGEIDIKRTIALRLSEVYGVSPAVIMGWEKSYFSEVTDKRYTYPVIGEVAAGYDSVALEDWEGDVIDVPKSYLKGREYKEYFVLRVKGDSMFPMYQDGDKVLVLKQSTCDYSGQTAVVIYDDENGTLKKIEYKIGENWLKLVPINPSYPSKRIDNEALEHCKVLGVPKMLIRDIVE